MAELKVTHDDFTLYSTWRVVTGNNGVKEITEGPSWAAKTVNFEYKIPSGAKLIGAHVHSVWSNPTSGFSTRSINGTWVPGDTWNVNVEIDPEATSFEATFRFRANGNTTVTGYTEGKTNVTEVYLLIEYKLNGIIYRAVSGALVPYQLYRAEDGVLVPYQIQHAEDGALAPYGG